MSLRADKRKIDTKVKVLLRSYFDFLSDMPSDISVGERNKMIKNILIEYDNKWQRICRSWKGVNTPNPTLFTDLVLEANRMNAQGVKTQIKEIKRPLLQRARMVFWYLFKPYKYDYLYVQLKANYGWKVAYENTKKYDKPDDYNEDKTDDKK